MAQRHPPASEDHQPVGIDHVTVVPRNFTRPTESDSAVGSEDAESADRLWVDAERLE